MAQAIVGILYATDESVDVLQLAQQAVEKMEGGVTAPKTEVPNEEKCVLGEANGTVSPTATKAPNQMVPDIDVDQENLLMS